MSGKLGKALTTGATIEVARIPMSVTYASVNILVSNPTSIEGECLIYIADNGTTPSNIDLIEPGSIIPVKGKLEWNCRLVSPGEVIYIKAPAGFVVRVESADEVLSV